MKNQNKNYTRYGILLALVVVGVGLIAWYALTPGKYDKMAICMKDSGVTFYGAFWCPHCQKTKQMFGKSVKKLPYVECSTPDGQGQLPVCKDAGISGYPTWIFADGTRLSGEQSLETLAQKSNCPLN